MGQKYAGRQALQAIKSWAGRTFMPISASSGGVILRLKFGAEFLGRTWSLVNQEDLSEVYNGVVDASLVKDVSVACTSATYIITLDALVDGSTVPVTRYLTTDKYFGIYPRLIKYVDIVPWNGDLAKVIAMVNAAEAGLLDLATEAGWQPGDYREVSLAAIEATSVVGAQSAQTVKLVLSHPGPTAGITRADGGVIHFQVDQLDCLANTGKMNSSNTNSGSWKGSAVRPFFDLYHDAIDEDIRPIFKKMLVTSAETYNGSSVIQTEDWFALRAEKEIFGSRTYSNSTEAAALEQIDLYKTASYRVKRRNGSADSWWERSPRSSGSSGFCSVNSNGSANYDFASSAGGLAPFGCI